MKFKKITLTKKELDSIPEKERLFFIHILNIFNEIICLQKLAFFSTNYRSDDENYKKIIDDAQLTQSVFILNILAGKLYEGWRVIEKDFLGGKISKEFLENFKEKEKISYDKLKKILKEDSLIKEIRRKFAFHYDTKEIETQFNEYLPDHEFDLYISEAHGSSFFGVNFILFHRILKLTNSKFNINADLGNDITAKDTLTSTVNNLFDVIVDTSRHFQNFIEASIVFLVKKHSWVADEIPHPPTVKTRDVKIPYFIEE